MPPFSHLLCHIYQPPEDNCEVCFTLKVPNPADFQSLVCQTPQMNQMAQMAQMMKGMQQFMNMMGGCSGAGSSSSRSGELEILYGAGGHPKRRKAIGTGPIEDDSQQSQTGEETTPPTRPAVLTPTPTPNPTPPAIPTPTPAPTANVSDALQVYNPVEAAARVQNALQLRKEIRTKPEEEEEEEPQDGKTTKRPAAKQAPKNKVTVAADKKTSTKAKSKSSGSKRPNVMKDGDSTVFYRKGKIQRNQGNFRVFPNLGDKRDRKFSILKYGESEAWRRACELLESGE